MDYGILSRYSSPILKFLNCGSGVQLTGIAIPFLKRCFVHSSSIMNLCKLVDLCSIKKKCRQLFTKRRHFTNRRNTQMRLGCAICFNQFCKNQGCLETGKLHCPYNLSIVPALACVLFTGHYLKNCAQSTNFLCRQHLASLTPVIS